MARARRTQKKLIAPLATVCALAAMPATCALGVMPAAALAAGGGSGLSSGGAGVAGSGAPGTAPDVQPAIFPISASANGITIQTLSAGSTSSALTFTGTVPAADTGRTVEIAQATGPAASPTWTKIATATVSLGGSFSTSWHARRSGRIEVEAMLLGSSQTASSDTSSTGPTPAATVPAGTPSSSGAVAPSGTGTPAAAPVSTSSSPPVTIDVFQNALATLYGPGFYGHKTACGQTLRRGTIGIASRTLRCGAKVAIQYGGQMLVVRVIDRGPFANGAMWDLTMATARALGISATASIGTIALSRN